MSFKDDSFPIKTDQRQFIQANLYEHCSVSVFSTIWRRSSRALLHSRSLQIRSTTRQHFLTLSLAMCSPQITAFVQWFSRTATDIGISAGRLRCIHILRSWSVRAKKRVVRNAAQCAINTRSESSFWTHLCWKFILVDWHNAFKISGKTVDASITFQSLSTSSCGFLPNARLKNSSNIQGGPIKTVHFEIPCLFCKYRPIFKILSPGGD